MNKFTLEPYKGINTRYQCPNCQQQERTFSRYIDTETGEYLHPAVGRCNREINCGYHYTPRQYFQDNNISLEISQHMPIKQPAIPTYEPSYIPVDALKLSLKSYESNNFTNYLIHLFGEEITSQLIGKYFIGTSKHWPGATVFWQIDQQSKVRTGKIMLYNPDTGKRVKEPFNRITWVHKTLGKSDFHLKQCLFGEHLLIDKTKPIAIVESEKTAIISSIYLPQFIWMATGGLANISVEKFSILKGRTVILFPDIMGFDAWNKKVNELRAQMPETRFEISILLEAYASEAERVQGFDIADYLIKYDWHEFIKEKSLSSGNPEVASDAESEKSDSLKNIYNSDSSISKSEYFTTN